MDMLDIYTDYWICQNKHATATGLSRMLEGDIADDKVTRFLRLNEFDSKSLWKVFPHIEPNLAMTSKNSSIFVLIVL